ncbi:MAG TPA: BON domain-containing protein [Candidatus Limnocylindria bacterium]
MKLVFGIVTGAILAFLFDPELGKRRRAQLVDRTGGVTRKARRRTRALGRKLRSDARGWQERIAHSDGGSGGLDDATLAQRVRSEVFRDRDVPKGQVSLNAENGVVVLRGQLDRPEEITDLEERVARVEGVSGVRNLLHLAGTRAVRP